MPDDTPKRRTPADDLFGVAGDAKIRYDDSYLEKTAVSPLENNQGVIHVNEAGLAKLVKNGVLSEEQKTLIVDRFRESDLLIDSYTILLEKKPMSDGKNLIATRAFGGLVTREENKNELFEENVYHPVNTKLESQLNLTQKDPLIQRLPKEITVEISSHLETQNKADTKLLQEIQQLEADGKLTQNKSAMDSAVAAALNTKYNPKTPEGYTKPAALVADTNPTEKGAGIA